MKNGGKLLEAKFPQTALRLSSNGTGGCAEKRGKEPNSGPDLSGGVVRNCERPSLPCP